MTPETAIPVPCLFLCREEYEEALRSEILARCGPVAAEASGPGLVRIEAALPEAAARALQAPLIFERQRLEAAVWLAAPGLKGLAREAVVRLMPAISRSSGSWTAHIFAPDTASASPLAPRAANLERVLMEFLGERFPAVARRFVPEREARPPAVASVLQLCLTAADGAWGSAMPLAALSDSRPGGIHRMPFDPRSPSRSYLKIEEAFDRMQEQPRRGQSAVDLGAAPGGWSHAFLKRGCTVTAVDRGPMRVPVDPAAGGELRHRREDGITFVPPERERPVDWLVSDMLQAAGTNIGMMRKWIEKRWMRRFVFNIKLPQQEPYPALRPLEEYLQSMPHVRYGMRQLYHDRREVTVWGWIGGDAGPGA